MVVVLRGMLGIELNNFKKITSCTKIRNRILDLKFPDGTSIPAILQDIQVHNVSEVPLHIDFLRVDEDSIVKALVPIAILNIQKCKGVKMGGVLNLVAHEVSVSCHPSLIPPSIEIDVQDLDIGRSIHMSDVKLPENVKFTSHRNLTLVTITGRAGTDTEGEETEETADAEPEQSS